MADVAIKSNTIDYLLGVGQAADQIARSGVEAPELEVTICNGVISVFKKGELLRQYGTAYCELTMDDWLRAAARLGAA